MLTSMISYNILMVDVGLDQGLFLFFIFFRYFNLNGSLVVFLKIVFVILKPPPPGSLFT